EIGPLHISEVWSAGFSRSSSRIARRDGTFSDLPHSSAYERLHPPRFGVPASAGSAYEYLRRVGSFWRFGVPALAGKAYDGLGPFRFYKKCPTCERKSDLFWCIIISSTR